MHVLLIEDDAELAGLIDKGLSELGMRVTRVGDAATGLSRMVSGEHDAVILDVMLPGGDGFALCAEARKREIRTPVLMLSARSAVEDRVHGLDAGADDYLSKPFAFPELVARLHALARRPPGLVDEVRTFGDLEVNLRTRAVCRAGRAVRLTSMEWRLLEFFVRNAGTVVDRAAITAYVWDDNHDPLSNMLEVLVSRLRRKLEDGRQPSLIETIRGAGYRFGPP
ncbi:MAG: response regulator transcription factor [Gemmatimonadetes bacterium]|nr:response regulator transcription factor [Gemmatimonadota bacterium]